MKALSFSLTLFAFLGCLQCKAKPVTFEEAESALKSGKYREAISAYKQMIASDAENLDANRGLFRAYLETGAYDAAEELARSLVLRQPTVADWHEHLGEIFRLRGRYSQAEDEFKAAIRLSREPNLSARVGLAAVYKAVGKKDQAKRIFSEVVEIANARGLDGPDDLYHVGLALFSLEQYHGANEAFRDAIEADPENVRAYVGRGNLFVRGYDYPYAAELFSAALKVNPNFAEAYLGLAKSKHLSHDSSAPDMCRRALEINPHLAEARNFLAGLAIEVEDYATALDELDKVLQVNPNDLQARSLRAACFYLLDRIEDFKVESQRVLTINPSYGELYLTLAEYCGYRTRYQEAAEFSKQALKLDDQLWAAHGALGINLLRMGDEKGGREHLEIAFDHDPFDVRTKNTLDLLDSFERYRDVSSKNFHVKLHEKEEQVMAPYVLELAERALSKLSEKYGFRPQTPLRLEIFPNHADFAVRTFGLPGIAASGACFGRVVVMDSPSAKEIGSFNWGSTLWHELTHVFTLQMTRHRIPRWLSEGLSVYEERLAYPGWGDDLNLRFLQAFKRGELLKLRELNLGFICPKSSEQVPISYLHASFICEYIAEKYGFEKILEMLKLYRDGKSSPEVFAQALGQELEDFDSSFLKYLKERLHREQNSVNLDLLKAAGHRRMTKEQLIAALKINPDDFFANLQLGATYKKEGDIKRAIEHLERAKAAFPAYVEGENPYKLLAEIYMKNGDNDRAIAELSAMLRYDESNMSAHQQLADLLLKKGDKRRAAEVLTAAMYVNPFDPKSHQTLGKLLLELKDYDGAIREFKVALALNPVDKAKAHLSLAQAYAAKGLRGEAKRQVLRALEIAPNYEEAQELLLKLVEN